MIKIKETDKVVSIKFKHQLAISIFELILILAAIVIMAAVSLPIYFDFTDRASEKLLNTAIAELDGIEKLAFAEIKNSQDGWVYCS
jgi:Zn-dependent membrane protease YugP